MDEWMADSWLAGSICKGLYVTLPHNCDVIMDAVASKITSLTIVYSTVYSDADQRKHQSSASLAFELGFHRGPVNSPHKWPVTRKMFSFDDVIMQNVSFIKLSHAYIYIVLQKCICPYTNNRVRMSRVVCCVILHIYIMFHIYIYIYIYIMLHIY